MQEFPQYHQLFSSISREEWEKQLLQELKGKPLNEVLLTINEKIRLQPFYTREEKVDFPELNLSKRNPGWEIAEAIDAINPEKANKIALEGLEMGASSILFLKLPPSPDIAFIEKLLKNIQTDYISLGFQLPSGQNSQEKWVLGLYEVLGKKQASSNQLFFSDEPLVPLQEYFPNSQFLPIFISAATSSNDISVGLANALSKGVEMLRQYESSAIYFNIETGNDYLLEIARLRALRLLWEKVQAALGFTDIIPAFLQVSFSRTSYTEDTYSNMIRSTAMAMAAVNGGVDRLFVLPADALTNEPRSFTRRIARNVQHILMNESYFAQVEDPAAGSYFFDMLTYKVAEEAWKEYTTKQ